MTKREENTILRLFRAGDTCLQLASRFDETERSIEIAIRNAWWREAGRKRRKK